MRVLRSLLAMLLALGAAPAAAPAAVEPVTPGADGPSGAASLSATGRYVAFASEASNLVPGDTNGASDVFVRDRLTGVTTRVSGGSGPSGDPSISGDGRVVAFASRSADLVPGDRNGRGIDVYVHDRVSGRTRRLTPGGGLYRSFDASVSARGGHVAFAAERVQPGEEVGDLVEAGPRRAYVAVLSSGAIGRVSVSSGERPAEGESGAPSISADGRFVAFESGAGNLVPGDRNGKRDVFVRDRRRGTTVRASVSSRERGASDSSFEPAIAAGGRHVAFTSRARDLAAGDDDRATDVYVRDLRRGATRRVSRGSAGRSITGWATAPSISADGDLVAFQVSRTDLVEQGDGPVGRVMVRKREARATWLVDTRRSGFPALSGDARLVAFSSGTAQPAGVYTDGPLR